MDASRRERGNLGQLSSTSVNGPAGFAHLMPNHPPIIAIIDDYEAFVPRLAAYAELKRMLPGADIRIVTSQPLEQAAIASLRDVEYLVLIRERSRITAALLDQLPALKALVQTGAVGAPETSHIDHGACAERGIHIVEGGSSDGHSTAEITWALILNARRHVLQYMESMANGLWQQGTSPHDIGHSLHGQVLGILGYGRIGQLLRRYAEAFDMEVMVWGREKSRQTANEHGVRFAETRDALFKHSDILTLHMRMNPDSRHSITLRELSLMKPGSLLVNTSRPGLIEPGALATALKAGRPGAAAIDVHEREPVLHNGEPQSLPNCIATPHIGYVEQHSYEILFGNAFRKLAAFIQETSPS